ncbi:acyl-CoA-binding domain-containing protein 5-B-like isoform X3 [Pungitius pungitius]|uniref:acyl-CoA-binding domain-containing protein 5-B-like isoform X3 n=1 Tax=Pungitius pungitius TaxID=134920 RepID=UPI002E13F0CE
MAPDEDTHSLEAKFVAAVKVIQSFPEEGPFQPSDDMMLMFDGYYKQATLGPCNISRPNGFWDPSGKAKWDAWRSLGNMTKKEAMENYVEDIQRILETIPMSDEVSDLVKKLGNFYAESDREGEEEEENEVDRRPFTRPFANSAEWRPDPRLLMVEKRMRSETWGSSSSMEPSMYSFTNGTHSSLNSEVEEEELAFCLEPSVQCNSNMHFNGHLSGQTDAFPEVKHRSDSDNEEFCDSMDHLAVEEGPSSSKIHSPGSGAASVRQRDLCYESSTTLKGREDQVLVGASYLKEGISSSQHNSSVSRRERGSQSPRTTCSSHRCTSVDPARRGVSQSGHPTSSARGDVNEQIATALLRLQRDMASVLQRLHALEGLSVSQGKPPTQVSTTSRSSSPRPEDSLPVAKMFLRPSWWPFDFSPLTAVLTALWPPIAHWLVQLYLQRRRRKIT